MDWKMPDRPELVWILSAAAFVVIAFGIPVLRAAIKRRCREPAGATPSWRSLLGRLNDRWLRTSTLVIALVVAVMVLDPEPRIAAAAKMLLTIMLAVQVFRLLPAVIDWGISRIGKPGEDGEVPASAAATLTGLRWVVLAAAYFVIFLIALQNLGVDVTAMIAGLGIGGIAVALALQNILGDLFGSLTIALDKPFVVGDFIVAGSEMGTVEYVGLKTTRIRSLSGEQLVFSNADLLSSRIRNFKRMAERRVLFGFGVTYDTPADVLEAIPNIVRETVASQTLARFDRCHFAKFGASSLDFELVYYIGSPEFNKHMDAQQAILLGITRAFNDRRIEFAFPTQTLHIASMWPPAEPAATT